MSYFVFVVKIMDKKFTISLQSRYAELWRYNIVVTCGCFDEVGERINFLSKENFVADVVQNEKLQIMNEFLTTIGINTANTTKREREIVDEVNANNIERQANIKLWKQNVEECCDKVNEMFPEAGLKITFPYYEDESVNRREEVTNEPDRHT